MSKKFVLNPAVKFINLQAWFVAISLILVSLGSVVALPYASYAATMALLGALVLRKKYTPYLFLSVIIFSIFLASISSLPYPLASLVPLLGFLFSQDVKSANKPSGVSNHVIFLSVLTIYLIYLSGYTAEETTGSHNHLTVLLAYALICEYLFYKRTPIIYMVYIAISLLIFGNRSSIFLLAAFIKSRSLAFCFIFLVAVLLGVVNGYIEPPHFIQDLTGSGGYFYRSYKESRIDYIDYFFRNLASYGFDYQNWDMSNIPLTADGFVDFHNSFLTIVCRDSFLGIFKVLLWFSQIVFLPLGFFVAITFRALHDTFLLGGVLDMALFALIGESLSKTLSRFHKQFKL